jgi:hypothetical protein
MSAFLPVEKWVFLLGMFLICYTVFKSFQIYLHMWAQIGTNQPPKEIRILVGGLTPSEKYKSQLGLLVPIYGTIKNVPNHQPEYVLLFPSPSQTRGIATSTPQLTCNMFRSF